jgi:ring-1,2-phenylacetyl-CoA epoxidase subunit PaaD
MNDEQEIWDLLETVPDPEVPVLSVNDLGIIRNVRTIVPSQSVEITITPTYSGCPAMDAISMNIRMALLQRGYKDIKIKTVLSPAWTSDWITEKGKQKLKAYGIAPPMQKNKGNAVELFAEPENVQCPQCNSYDTTMISEFGSTACKSLYRCNSCDEPFDHFKCH